MLPETRYARSGDIRIAYQVVGSGPADLVFVPGFISNLDHYWDNEELAHFLTRLASFSRLIVFDKRGTGLSDRPGRIPSLEERMDDLRAVTDAVGSERAAIFGISEGGAMSALYAATYPHRCTALMLYGTYAHFFSSVVPEDEFQAYLAGIDERWGTGASVAAFAPTRVRDERFVRWWARFERLGASPSAVLELARMNSEIDVRHILPSIRTPTLVLHRTQDSRIGIAGGRAIAAAIPGARLVELDGIDHVLWSGNVDAVADEIELFVTGSKAELEPDRILATVLFTDIVGSTAHAARLGDHAWQQLLDQHDRMVRAEIAAHRGQEVKTLGDGFLATFDGPGRAVRCASAVVAGLQTIGLEVRAGLHTGEVELTEGDVRGLAVTVAARITGLAAGGEVLASSTVRDIVAGARLVFADRGFHALKGLDEEVRLFAVVP